MNLRWLQFERQMGQRVLQYDIRRRMTFWHRVEHSLNNPLMVPLGWFRAAVSFGIAFLILVNAEDIVVHPRLSAGVLGFWCLVVSLGAAGLIWNSAQTVPEYLALRMLPLSPQRSFAHLVWCHSTGALWVFLESLLVYLLLASGSNHLTDAVAGALVFAGLQTVLYGTLALLLIALRVKLAWVFMPLFLVGWSLLLFSSSPKITLLVANVIDTLNPFGWVSRAYLRGWPRGDSGAWLGLLPVLLGLATLPFSLRRVRLMHERGVFRAPPSRPAGILLTPREETSSGESDGTADVAQALHRFSRSPDWARYGPIERGIQRLLAARETLVAEMLLPSSPRWSNRLFGFLTYYVLFLLASTQIRFSSLDPLVSAVVQSSPAAGPAVVAMAACLILFGMMLANALFLFMWFEPLQAEPNAVSGPRASWTGYRLFPVSYWETARVIAKVNSLVALLLLPPAALFSFTPAYQAVIHDPQHHAAIMPKGVILLWGVTLLLLTFKLSPSIQSGLKYWRYTAGTLVVTACFAGVGGAFLVSPSLGFDIALAAVWIASVLACFRYSGAQYCRCASSHWLNH